MAKLRRVFSTGSWTIVGDRGDGSAAEIVGDETFQHVVDVFGAEIEVRANRAFDFTFTNKVTDTGTEQSYARERQRNRRFFQLSRWCSRCSLLSMGLFPMSVP
jgi:hypothetical protein